MLKGLHLLQKGHHCEEAGIAALGLSCEGKQAIQGTCTRPPDHERNP